MVLIQCDPISLHPHTLHQVSAVRPAGAAEKRAAKPSSRLCVEVMQLLSLSSRLEVRKQKEKRGACLSGCQSHNRHKQHRTAAASIERAFALSSSDTTAQRFLRSLSRSHNATTKMKTMTVLTIAALAASAVSAQEFSAADKALWIDRHNYFRMTALPFSAANMLRIKWSDDLATAATAEAKGCAAVTGAGINAHTHSDGAAATSIVDAAFKEWAVAGAIKTLPNVPAPKVAGDAVGANVYSSYSQIVWASTNQVGCGYATCTTGKLVVCKYAPAGNTAGEPWYIHGPPNTQCPAGTEGKLGLCIVPGDAGNNDIAPIPAGQNAYDAFASAIGTVQKVLKGETVDAGPVSGTSASTNPGSAATTTTSAPTGDAATTAGTTAAPTGDTTASGATTAGATDAATAGTSDTGAATATTSGSSATAATTGDAATTDATSTATAGGSTSDDESSAVKSIGFGSLTSGSDGTPGTVRAGSNTGSTFSNEATANGGSPSTAAATAQNAESTATGGSGTANNKSGDDSSAAPRFSAAGVAGVIVIGVAMVAGFAVFVSYRKNQRRQRDIMQNGGIHVL